MSRSSELHSVWSIVKPVFSFPVVVTNTPEKVNEAEAEMSPREGTILQQPPPPLNNLQGGGRWLPLKRD